jgi:DNA-binding CsgD family transcriptional regulator
MVLADSSTPLERRVLRLLRSGVNGSEIARMFRRSPEFIERVAEYAHLHPEYGTHHFDELRPIERRVLKWRAQGADHDEIGRRFMRSADSVRRIETLAQHKLHGAVA